MTRASPAACLAFVLLALGVGCAGGSDKDSDLGDQGQSQIRFDIDQQSSSGESGTVAMFPLRNRKTRVTIELTGMDRDGIQPAHVHKGTCDDLDPKPAFGLTPVRERANGTGRSVTVIPVGLEELEVGPHAVNVHRSATAANIYVACGNIPNP